MSKRRGRGRLGGGGIGRRSGAVVGGGSGRRGRFRPARLDSVGGKGEGGAVERWVVSVSRGVSSIDGGDDGHGAAVVSSGRGEDGAREQESEGKGEQRGPRGACLPRRRGQRRGKGALGTACAASTPRWRGTWREERGDDGFTDNPLEVLIPSQPGPFPF